MAPMSAWGQKADVTLLNFDVRFTPESGHSPTRSRCLLWAISRHSGPSPNVPLYPSKGKLSDGVEKAACAALFTRSKMLADHEWCENRKSSRRM